MKKWEVVLVLRGSSIETTVAGILARSAGEAVGHALSHLAMPSTWQVHHVAEVVAV